MLRPVELNSIDILPDYMDALRDNDTPPVQLLGGIGSVALLHPSSVIDMADKRIVAPADLALSNYRDDGNLRDIETLVLSTRKEDVMLVAKIALATIGNLLITETFDIKDDERITKLAASPLSIPALKMVLSDRYMPANTVLSSGGPEPRRILLPFSAPIEAAALETWTLQVGDSLEIPVPHPGATIINYLTRSISGLRTKDKDKVQKMATAVFGRAPEIVDWIVDGPGEKQFELAQIFHTLRESKRHPRDLRIGGQLTVSPLPLAELSEHRAFMFPDADPRTIRNLLSIARRKSRLLHLAESNPRVVTTFQRMVEPAIGSLVHNM
jgi:hypothetical protein